MKQDEATDRVELVVRLRVIVDIEVSALSESPESPESPESSASLESPISHGRPRAEEP